VPVLIQDRLFASDGSFQYRMVNHLGAKSGTMLVNGAPWPGLDVSTRLYRFRIVNGSNATPLRLALSSGDPLIQIATDGGFGPLPSPSWRINGQRFDSETPIASPRYGDVEIWRFINTSFLGVLGIVHPVHVHLVTLKVFQRNGGPPLPHETGWKDTVAGDRDEDVSVIAKFEGYRGRYLLHATIWSTRITA
jgi:FtsP/CotA-like multicopper oxidase with cupredoxin domain